jgi:outer membrane protein OmpA-like peptidoglycan-associated protein/tetratricopeptide (TPR) repeat protein
MKNALLGLFFLIPTVLFAQNVDFKKRNFPNDPEGFNKAQMNFSKGQELYYRGPRFYESALNYLLEANTFNPNNTDLNIILGTAYNALNLKGEAAEFYKKAAALDPNYKKEGMLLSAENLHLDLQWTEAIREYVAYKNFIISEAENSGKRKQEEAQNEIVEINRRIDQCENGKVISSDTVEIILVNLGKNVNSKYPDYSPVVTADEKKMFFTSQRPNTTGGKIPPGQVYHYDDIYESVKINGGWSSAKQIPGKANTNNHDASVGISPDGKKMIIYRPLKKGNLFETTLGEDGLWTKPKSLKGINSKFRETHASYSPDGKWLYFTSSNPKIGAKGLDIFRTSFDQEKGSWTTPERLSDMINTEMDEDGIYISQDGSSVYFSSNGHNTMGGYDIFRSDLQEGQIGTPVNMGYPVNNSADDVFFVAMPGGKKAYFGSDRRGGLGEKDVYAALLTKGLDLQFESLVTNEETGEPIGNATMEVSLDNVPVTISAGGNGRFSGTVKATERYRVLIRAKGYNEVEEYFTADLTSPDTFAIRKDFKMSIQRFITIKGKVTDELTNEPVSAKVEFFELMGDEKVAATIDANAYSASLNLKKVYRAVVSAEGYQTFEEIVSLDEHILGIPFISKDFFLLKPGIQPIVKEILISGKIYEKPDGISKNGKIIIRDEQFNQIATLNVDAESGYQVKLKTNTVYNFFIESEGLEEVSQRIVFKVSKYDTKTTRHFFLQKSTKNYLAFKTIYFQFDKSDLLEEALTVLNSVKKILMEFPEAKVDISGHTDAMGPYDYNLQLSLQRAKTALNWLLANGVSKERVTYNYYSFTKPAEPNRNPDGSDNPDGRRKNRRVEFKVYSKSTPES